MVTDPLLAEVGWTWLTDGLVRPARTTAMRPEPSPPSPAAALASWPASRIVPRSRSARPADPELELPLNFEPPGRTADLLCTTAGLPPRDGVIRCQRDWTADDRRRPLGPADPVVAREGVPDVVTPSTTARCCRPRPTLTARWPSMSNEPRATATRARPIWCNCGVRGPAFLIDPILLAGEHDEIADFSDMAEVIGSARWICTPRDLPNRSAGHAAEAAVRHRTRRTPARPAQGQSRCHGRAVLRRPPAQRAFRGRLVNPPATGRLAQLRDAGRGVAARVAGRAGGRVGGCWQAGMGPSGVRVVVQWAGTSGRGTRRPLAAHLGTHAVHHPRGLATQCASCGRPATRSPTTPTGHPARSCPTPRSPSWRR